MVIVPLVSLLHDLKERARALGIHVYIWDKDGVTIGLEQYDLILVQMENCGHFRFSESLRNLAPHMGRIIYDEAHMLVADRGYRASAVNAAISVRVHNVPIICLSATLPRSISETLENILQIKHFIDIRPEHTVRPNIRYAKANIGSSIERDTASIQRIRREWASGARVIIYCGSYDDCRSMARQLNGDDIRTWIYIGDMTSNQKKDALQNLSSSHGLALGTEIAWLYLEITNRLEKAELSSTNLGSAFDDVHLSYKYQDRLIHPLSLHEHGSILPDHSREWNLPALYDTNFPTSTRQRVEEAVNKQQVQHDLHITKGLTTSLHVIITR